MTIKYIEKTIVALDHYKKHASKMIIAFQKVGNESKENEWRDVLETYSEMINTYSAVLDHQKRLLEDQN